MDFLKRYPIPIAGLILGLFALGNLVQSYSPEARHVFGVIAFVLYVPYLLKVIVLNVKLSEPLDNPVAASVFPDVYDGDYALGRVRQAVRGVCKYYLVRGTHWAYSADIVVHGEICAARLRDQEGVSVMVHSVRGNSRC